MADKEVTLLIARATFSKFVNEPPFVFLAKHFYHVITSGIALAINSNIAPLQNISQFPPFPERFPPSQLFSW